MRPTNAEQQNSMLNVGDEFSDFMAEAALSDGFEPWGLQWEIADWLDATEHAPERLLMAFRFSGKSWMTAVYSAYLIWKDPEASILCVSSNPAVSRATRQQFRSVIERHPRTKRMVSSAALWSGDELRLGSGRFPSMHASSIFSNETGLHASTLLIADDLETGEAVDSIPAAEKLNRYIERLTPLAKKVLWTGTPWRSEAISMYTPILERLPPECVLQIPYDPARHSEALSEEDFAIATEKLKAVPNWLRSQYYLEFADVGGGDLDPAFLRTYNVDVHVSFLGYRYDMGATRVHQWRTGLPAEMHETTIDGRKMERAVAALDPAFARGRDKSILTIVYQSGPDYFVHDIVELPPATPERDMGPQLDAIKSICTERAIDSVVVEESGMSSISLSLSERNIAAIPITQSTSKEKRLRLALQGPLAARNIHVREGAGLQLLRHEMTEFPRGKHDDAMDSLALAIDSLGRDLGVTSYEHNPRSIDQYTFREVGKITVTGALD